VPRVRRSLTVTADGNHRFNDCEDLLRLVAGQSSNGFELTVKNLMAARTVETAVHLQPSMQTADAMLLLKCNVGTSTPM
jgi:hypothetical protein